VKVMPRAAPSWAKVRSQRLITDRPDKAQPTPSGPSPARLWYWRLNFGWMPARPGGTHSGTEYRLAPSAVTAPWPATAPTAWPLTASVATMS
jgi:hypothetical protein